MTMGGISELEPDDEFDDMDDAILDEEEEGEPPIQFDEESPNFVADLMATREGQEWVRKIGDKVFDEVTTAWDSQEEHRDRVAADWAIFRGELPPKTFPFENCANAHVPIMLENMSRLSMRVYGELFGDFTDVFGVQPVGPDDREVADTLTRHGNWQISTEMQDFPRQMERLTLLFLGPGDAVVNTYYDRFARKNRCEVLTCDEFVAPYVHVTTEPDFSDCPWTAIILRRYKHEMQRMRGEWFDVDSVIEGRNPAWDDEPDAPLAETQADGAGIDRDENTRAPYKLYQYDGWIELPNQLNERFCRVIVDCATKAVLLIQVLEEEDWQDRIRHDTQVSELQTYRQQLEYFQGVQTGMVPPPMDQATGMLAPMEPPQPPEWADPEMMGDPAFEPEPVRRVPYYMKTHAVCIEPLSGPLGLGYGTILGDYNAAANTALSQFTDSATLANVATWLAAGNFGSKKKPIEVKPGQVNLIPGIAAKDLDSVMKRVDFQPGNPQLIELVKMFEEWGQAATQAPSVLSGEAGKSGETYRGIATRIEQATKQLSVTTAKLGRAVTNILRCIARLNATFLPENQILYINNHKQAGSLEPIEVRREMYRRDYRVVLRSDVRFASQAARISEADQLVQMWASLPPLQANPLFGYHAIREALVARGKEEMARYLGPPPPAPPVPFGMVPPPPPGAPGGPPPGGPGQPPPQPPSAPQEGPPVAPEQ